MTTRSDRLRIVVLGYVVRGPVGGMAWHHLNYVRGLADMGHDVLFMEDSDDYPLCYDPSTFTTGCDPRYGIDFARRAFDLIGLADDWCYFDAHADRWMGPAAHRAIAFCRDADLVLNISAMNPLRDWTGEIPVRAYVDTDPLFTQARHCSEPEALERARQHNRFFTFGELIPQGRSMAPDDGITWHPTRQPVALSAWDMRRGQPDGAMTTVMQWDSYRTRRIGWREFGMKSASFAGYEDLPSRVDAAMALALGGDTAPHDALAALGWRIDDPMEVTRTVESYRDYIGASKGEWSVAKHGYVAGRTGWFSERSACFLASGRPVVVEDTGCSQFLDADGGLIFFSTPDEAVEAIREIESDYTRHCSAAREVAETHFAAHGVLSDMIEHCAVADSEKAVA
ncbi:hypothetical protein [Croceicoccus mobilis]|uniref:Glycosyltransferase family 1 protein n=1 Tax=Croceicoccus mobilis TaxID=1703339 RepID=A0A917DSG4_9SPHN|nr:hypothetical protein [Croceicoccus mobilis]GGD65784.1 hypothetical protein GCM10010990_14080 [Croceicoccus mobilis]